MGNKNTKLQTKPKDGVKGRAVSRNQELKRATREMSCVQDEMKRKRTGAGDTIPPPNKQELEEEDVQAGHDLAKHLISISPFNKRWQVKRTINEGTFGVVFEVRDIETNVNGVIKVAKSNVDCNGWEAFILEKQQRANPSSSVVRILDKGVLADQNGQGLEFICLEKAEIQVMDYLNQVTQSDGNKCNDSKFTGVERRLHVTYVLLDMLKGIHDLHMQGLLHRDSKPDNMGIYSEKQPMAVLFDLGLARMYTGYFGEIRLPRSTVSFRGTPEWASGHAQKGREQGRIDDLIAWMYVGIELYDESKNPMQPLPWTGRENTEVLRYLKSMYAPARLLFRHTPRQFFAINSYLMTANRFEAPDYRFLAKLIERAIDELQITVEEQTGFKQNRYSKPADKQAPNSQQVQSSQPLSAA
ncbi:Protein kinase domain-containing protein [Aphelenchoides besseyi]|nr:Protein kinase domain-containing protein [Aphelenchoides besseyi]KAI6210575.1 Protein kinase domain-containing protein [Aphelenchoides besseyi]